jgi:hypothetical protein
LSFVVSPWWIWWLLFSCCRCVTVVLYALCIYSTGCMVGQLPCTYYSTVCAMLVPEFIHRWVTFVCFAKSAHIDHLVLTFVPLFDSDSHYFLALYKECN